MICNNLIEIWLEVWDVVVIIIIWIIFEIFLAASEIVMTPEKWYCSNLEINDKSK